MRISSFTTPVLASLAFYTSGVYGHSWIENVTITGGAESPDGTLGYIRGYVGHIDAVSSYRIEKSLSELACAPSQLQAKNTAQYPRLTAASGDVIMGMWLENGHISLPLQPNSTTGSVYWYGTTKQDPTVTLGDVLEWTMDGKGGNGKGVLLSSEPFDDGVCIEPNNSPAAKARLAKGGGGACKGTFTIPEGLASGSTYTVYWVWDFAGKNGEPAGKHFEWYTSCMDINIRTPGANSTAGANGTATPGVRKALPRALRSFSAKFRLPKIGYRF